MFLPHFRLYRFVGYFFFLFCIKEEYKTNDSSTNRVADRRYFVKQNVHEFSIKSFLLSKSCSEPFYIAFFYYISFMFCRCSVFGNFLTVTLRDPHFFENPLIFVYKKASCSYNFRSLSNSLCCIKNSVINRLQVIPFA
jgi:hypothetical protein